MCSCWCWLSLFLISGAWGRASRQCFLDSFKLPTAVVARTHAKRPELTLAQMTLVQQGSQQYFQICVAAGGRFVSMPSHGGGRFVA